MALEYAWLAPFALAALAVLVIAAWHLSKDRRKKVIVDNLSKDGQKAVSFIRKNGGRMQQKTLQKKMKMSGPRFNKLLRAMEELEAIKRVPGARENTIELLV